MHFYSRPDSYDISYNLVLESIGCSDGFLFDMVQGNRLLVNKIIGLEDQRLILESGVSVNPTSVTFNDQDDMRALYKSQSLFMQKFLFLSKYGLRVKKNDKILVLDAQTLDVSTNVVEFSLGYFTYQVSLDSIDLREQKKLYLDELKQDFLAASSKCFAAADKILNDPSLFYSYKQEFASLDIETFDNEGLLDNLECVELYDFVSKFMLFLEKEVPVMINLIEMCTELAFKHKLFVNFDIYENLTSFVGNTAPNLELIVLKSKISHQGRFLTRKNVESLLETWRSACEVFGDEQRDLINQEVSLFIETMFESSKPEKFVTVSEIDEIILGLRDLARFFLTQVGFPILNSNHLRASLFELYDAFNQRRDVIRRFLELSLDTSVLRGLTQNQILDQINILTR